MICLASEFDIIVDRLVDTPGHGKDVVDGMNAQDRVYLRHNMITAKNTDQTGDSEESEVKFDAALADGDEKEISFADQCVKICSAKSRKKGAESREKSKKREGNKKVLERLYHLQKQDDFKYQENKYKLTGLDRGGKNSMMDHYNLRFEKQLGIKHCAMRRIPCFCDACLEKLILPWDLTNESFLPFLGYFPGFERLENSTDTWNRRGWGRRTRNTEQHSTKLCIGFVRSNFIW